MKKMMLVLIAGVLFSCQTSKITDSWTAKDNIPKYFNKILVLGVLKDIDRDLQSKMEKHLAGDLKEMGYQAYAASEIYPPGTFVRGDTARAIKAMNEKEFDAVLTIVLLNKEKERYYVPGRVVYTPYVTIHNRFDRYYYIMYDRIYSEGYYATDTKYFWESNFYDIGAKKMIYSAQTQSFDPGSKENLAHSYGMLIAENLEKSGIILKSEPRGF